MGYLNRECMNVNRHMQIWVIRCAEHEYYFSFINQMYNFHIIRGIIKLINLGG